MDCESVADTSEVAETWTMRPCQRRRPMDDPFFDEGNILCHLQYKQMTVTRDEVEELSSQVPEFTCHVSRCHCNEVFTTTASYELHYNSVHRNVCSVCRRMFPTFHLLDIHILESHDAMFMLLAAKQKMYRCLVETCCETFMMPDERKDHLIRAHKYPSNFRFTRQKKHAKTNTRTEKAVACDEPIASGTSGVGREERMDTLPAKERTASHRVPRTICFGRGVQRAFLPQRGRRKKGKSQHWHQKNGETSMDTAPDHMAMDSLTTALPD